MFRKICYNSASTFKASPLVFYRSAWYEDARLLLIIVTVCVVLPLAMLPKIGKSPNKQKTKKFQLWQVWITPIWPDLSLFLFNHQRIPGLHQQPCLCLHALFYSCGELWPKPLNICWLYFSSCWLPALLSCFQIVVKKWSIPCPLPHNVTAHLDTVKVKKTCPVQMQWCKGCCHWTLVFSGVSWKTALIALCQVYSLLQTGWSCGSLFQEITVIWNYLGSSPFLLQHDSAQLHKTRSIKTWTSCLHGMIYSRPPHPTSEFDP